MCKKVKLGIRFAEGRNIGSREGRAGLGEEGGSEIDVGLSYVV